MEWTDQGIVLSARPHGEGGMVVALLTHDHGRHAGFVPGGGSRRARPTWQLGNLVEVSWRARLAEQLGNFAGELREAHAARALDDAAIIGMRLGVMHYAQNAKDHAAAIAQAC